MMSPFADSTELLQQPAALRQRLDEEGYLYLRDVVDRGRLAALRGDIASICRETGWLREATCDEDFVAWTEPAVEGEPRYFEVYDRVQALESFHSLPHSPALEDLMKTLLGPTAFPHPLGIARLVFPYNEEFATPPHQDYPNNQGTPDLYACWIPLTNCPTDRGPLAIAPGSHRDGVLPLEYALGAGHRQIAPSLAAQFDYLSNPLEEGDILIFHSQTVHRSLPNTTEAMRISVDYRFQREGEALVEQSLAPHFQRLDWEQVYEGWESRELQYYWHEKRFEVVEWDPSLHQVPQSLEEAVAESMRYKQRRLKRAEKFR